MAHTVAEGQRIDIRPSNHASMYDDEQTEFFKSNINST